MFGGSIVENILRINKIIILSVAYFPRFISVCRNLELEFLTGRESPFFVRRRMF